MGSQERVPPPLPGGPHDEAVEFVVQHKDFFEHYARGQVHIEPAPEGLKTFAFDLEKDTVYVNSRFYKEKLGLDLSDEKTSFATLHELEHFLEKKTLLAEPGGQKAIAKYVERIKESKAFGLMDNCVADIRENRAVVARTSEGYGQLEADLYRQDLFPQTSFLQEPRHVQFAYALLRETRVPGERCEVAPEVRDKLDALRGIASAKGTNLLEAMTRPATPMSLRLKLQEHYIWPMVQELLEQDMKEAQEKEGAEQRAGEGQTGNASEQAGQKKPEPGAGDPNETFREAYERAEKKVPNAVPVEEMEKALKKWQGEGKGNPLGRADKERAEKLGVKEADMKRYQQVVADLEKIKNPQTGESVVAELRQLVERIIAKRLKPQPMPQYPLEEGEDLVDPADLVAEVKAGNLQPKVWETTEMQERRGAKFGEVDAICVFDRSGSMDEDGGKKRIEQQRCGILVMEALKQLAERCAEERVNLDKPLRVRSAMYSFQGDAKDSVPLKELSAELTEKQRIEVAAALATTRGQSTTDFVTLEAIADSVTAEETANMAQGELKKIVIVFTDGDSADPARVQIALHKLRGKGVVIVGVGITEDGQAALTTYAPDARLARKTEDLVPTLADLLREHLADI